MDASSRLGCATVWLVPREFDNRISLQKLEVLCLVVELGGVGRAAERLFVSQPVVTGHLRSLQERLGSGPLLYRDGRQMKLTESGEQIYAWASEMLIRTREVVREVDGLADGRRGSISVAASLALGSYQLPALLTEFRELHPQADLSMHILDPPRAIAGAESGEFDFVVVVIDSPPREPQLHVEHVGDDQVVLVTAPDAEHTGASVRRTELANLPLVAAPQSTRQLQAWGIEAHDVVIELGHPIAIKAATAAGLGVALLYRCAVETELADGTLREVAIEDATLTSPVFMIRRAAKRLTPIQEELFDVLQSRLRQRLQQPTGAST